jgi:response regulator RpfG family c-di-GMP phosphodiesterase
MTQKILFVDDEPNILSGFERLFRKEYQVDTANSGAQALEKIAASGPYAVVLSDMRMPNMGGAELLARVKDVSPDSVRMVLTGETDIGAAIQAVNEGAVFRFMLKPCSEPTLRAALNAALRQYALEYSERDLLEKTLSGCVKVLTEILSLVNPAAFGRSVRIRRYVRDITEKLGLQDTWQFEVAAMLSQIGCVTLPPATVEAIYAGEPLSENDARAYQMHSSVAHDLLVQVPRLEGVAMMICRQDEPFASAAGHDLVTLGAQMLKVCHAFDEMVVRGKAPEGAFEELRQQRFDFSTDLVDALADVRLERSMYHSLVQPIDQLETGMIIDQDVRTHAGQLLAGRGQEISYPMLVRLNNFHHKGSVPEAIRVLALRPAAHTTAPVATAVE